MMNLFDSIDFKKNSVRLSLGLIALAALSRLLPHAPNFTAIGGIALFAGSQFSSRKAAIVVPLTALFVTDLFLGLHPTMIFVYASVILSALLSYYFLKSASVAKLAGASVISSLLFFAITNGGAWWTMYPHTIEGFSFAYIAGVPFFANELFSNLFSTFLLFGFSYALNKFYLTQKV